MWFLLLLSSRLFSCLASECTCAGTLLPWPRRSTISDCLVSTPQSLSQVMKFSLMPRSLYIYVLVCFIIPSHHASVPYIFLSHETRSKKEIIHIPFHSCPWDPATLWQDLRLYFEGIAPRGPPLPTASPGVKLTTAGTSATPRSRTISLLRGSPRSAQMPEAGSWKTTIDPSVASKKCAFWKNITHGCKNLEIKCHQISPKMSNFVTLWVFSMIFSFDLSPTWFRFPWISGRLVWYRLQPKPCDSRDLEFERGIANPGRKNNLRSTYPQCEEYSQYSIKHKALT